MKTKETRTAMKHQLSTMWLLGFCLMLAVISTVGCRRNVIIESVPPGASMVLVQDPNRPVQSELLDTEFRTPTSLSLKERTHTVRLTHPDYVATDFVLRTTPLAWHEVISFQWLGKKGNLRPKYTFELAQTSESLVSKFADDVAAQLSNAIPSNTTSIAVYPFLNRDGQVTELGQELAGNMANSIHGRMGLQPRLFAFSQVRRYLVDNEMGLGPNALGEGSDLALYANQLGIDVIVVGRVRSEGGSAVRDTEAVSSSATGYLKVDVTVIDPQTGNVLGRGTHTIQPGMSSSEAAGLMRKFGVVIPEATVPLRDEVAGAAQRLARKLIESYRVRQGPQANVKFADFQSDPTFWGEFTRREFERTILAESGGLLTPVPEGMDQTDLGFDPSRRQRSTPVLLSEYQFSFVGSTELINDRVSLSVTMRQPNGDVMLNEKVEFSLQNSGIQRREWKYPLINQ